MFVLLVNTLVASEKADTIKGVMVERISHFITYGQEGGTGFIVCVYGNNTLANTFKTVYTDRRLNSLPIIIKSISSLSEPIDSCDIFFAIKPVDVKALNLQSTLLITEDESVLDEGYMIALFFENQKIRFSINHQAIEDSNLKVNYRLLKAASRVINPVRN